MALRFHIEVARPKRKTGIPKAGIPKAGIPKAGIPLCLAHDLPPPLGFARVVAFAQQRLDEVA